MVHHVRNAVSANRGLQAEALSPGGPRSVVGLGGETGDIEDEDFAPGQVDQATVSELPEGFGGACAAGTREGGELLMGQGNMDSGGAVTDAVTRESGQGGRDALVNVLEGHAGQAAFGLNQAPTERFGDPAAIRGSDSS